MPLYFSVSPLADKDGYKLETMYLPDDKQLFQGDVLSVDISRHPNHDLFLATYRMLKEDIDDLTVVFGHTHPPVFSSCPSNANTNKNTPWGNDMELIKNYVGLEEGQDGRYAPIHIIMAPWLNTIGAFRYNPDDNSISYLNILQRTEIFLDDI